MRAILLVAVPAAVALFGVSPAHRAGASNPADPDLFALTNQDRASNGVGALQGQATLGAIGENRPYSGCGFVVDGRSQDMINRNYFSHPIAGCGQLVFSMMTADGIHYLSAGENIGWASGTQGAVASANYINLQFMNSPDHRTNILNPRYTHLGIGTAQSNSWSGAGGTYSDVWMFSEEFAQLASSRPPPPPPPPTRPRPRSTALPPRNSPAPPPPAVPPVTTAVPTAAPTPAPTAAPTPVPSGDLTPSPPPSGETGGLTAPMTDSSPGLLSDSVEAVLEAYLVD